ncbi:MAG: hypothetical protein PVG03_18075 [Desulfarculaceae bacterium]
MLQTKEVNAVFHRHTRQPLSRWGIPGRIIMAACGRPLSLTRAANPEKVYHQAPACHSGGAVYHTWFEIKIIAPKATPFSGLSR